LSGAPAKPADESPRSGSGRGADDITCICLLAAPEGIERIQALLADLDVPCTLVVSAVDERLNDRGFIVPGLGDAGDRLYGLAD